ncbi:Uncharacterized protein SCF082_LOCUS52077, partial [Durusdinium trenchii]
SDKTCKLHLLYEQWCSASEKWERSSLVLRMKKSVLTRSRGARRWMTKKEICSKYNEEVAEEIIASKFKEDMENILWKKHPELPERKELYLYLCWDESTEEDVVDDLVETMFEGYDEDRKRKQKEEKTSKKKDKKSRKHQSSTSETNDSSDESSASSSDKNSSDDDESSSSSKKKKKGKKNKKSKKNQKHKKDKNAKKNKKCKKSKKAKSTKPKGSKRESASGKDGKDDKEKEKDKQKEEEKRKREEQRNADRKLEKDKQEKRSKAKKALNDVMTALADIARREQKTKDMSENLKAAVIESLDGHKSELKRMSPYDTDRKKDLSSFILRTIDDVAGAETATIRAPVRDRKSRKGFKWMNIEMLEPYSVIQYLWCTVGLEIDDAQLHNFWAEHRARGTPWAVATETDFIPLALYGDGCRIRQVSLQPVQKAIGIFLSCPLYRPKSARACRWLLCTLDENLLYKEVTLNKIFARIVWSLNLLWEDRFPACDPFGQPVPERFRARIGTPITGKRFQVVEFRGDWVWQKQVFRFNSTWLAGARKPVCFACPAYRTGQCRYTDVTESSPLWDRQYTYLEFLNREMPASGLSCLAEGTFKTTYQFPGL